MESLNVTQTELLSFLKSGKLCRPGKFGLDRVAWRRDEIEMLRDMAHSLRILYKIAALTDGTKDGRTSPRL